MARLPRPPPPPSSGIILRIRRKRCCRQRNVRFISGGNNNAIESVLSLPDGNVRALVMTFLRPYRSPLDLLPSGRQDDRCQDSPITTTTTKTYTTTVGVFKPCRRYYNCDKSNDEEEE